MRRPCQHVACLFLLGLATTIAAAQTAPPKPGPKPPAPAAPDRAETVRRIAALTGGSTEIVFAERSVANDPHWYANFGYWCHDEQHKLYGSKGRLCRLDLASGRLTLLIDDPAGAVRDPQVSYDGKRILFSYRKGGSEHFLLHEIDADGRNLRAVTSGPWDDLEPTYLPDGGIIFVSSRSMRWVNCWSTQVATLFRCDADGRNLRMLSANVEQDNTPWVLPDGRILFTRWEYVDRSQLDYHHLWVMNPDGSNQTIFFGNHLPGRVMIDAKPIPGSDRVVASFNPGHGRREHAGAVTIVGEHLGPDDPAAEKVVNPKADFMDPYPLAMDLFLVAQGNRLLAMDGAGRLTPLHTGSDGVICAEPRPLMPRPREKVIAPRIDLGRDSGTVALTNAYYGRNMDGVKPGEIRRFLVLESLPKPVNFNGGMNPLTVHGSFTLERVLGTVPVEEDGSAHFAVPANRALILVALDAENRSVKRMQSFFTVMPGERLGCVGCHESKTAAPQRNPRAIALQRSPSPLTPLPGIPQVIDFPRDIQPVLDRHCVRCHDTTTYAGRVNLSGGRGPTWSQSYFELTHRAQFFVGNNMPKSEYPARTIGDSISPLMWKTGGYDHDVRLNGNTWRKERDVFPGLDRVPSTAHREVRMTPAEILLLRTWINAGATYPGTYASLGDSGCLIPAADVEPGKSDASIRHAAHLPTHQPAHQAVHGRCVSCHHNKDGNDRRIPATPSDWGNGRYSQHRLFDLTNPERSLILKAPLAKAAGGLGICDKDGKSVFAATDDKHYQAILASVKASGGVLDTIKRFDMPGFVPNRQWIREMKRYGMLPVNLDPAKTPIDVYETEEKYWRSMWFKPVATGTR